MRRGSASAGRAEYAVRHDIIMITEYFLWLDRCGSTYFCTSYQLLNSHVLTVVGLFAHVAWQLHCLINNILKVVKNIWKPALLKSDRKRKCEKGAVSKTSIFKRSVSACPFILYQQSGSEGFVPPCPRARSFMPQGEHTHSGPVALWERDTSLLLHPRSLKVTQNHRLRQR